MSENGEIYTAGKNFILPPALTALKNSTSGPKRRSKRTIVYADMYVHLCLQYRKLQM